MEFYDLHKECGETIDGSQVKYCYRWQRNNVG